MRHRISSQKTTRSSDRKTTAPLFLRSLPADTPTIANAIRQHWGIENHGHWYLDVIFREDACRVRLRNAARNLSTRRVFCLNLLRYSTLRGSLRIKRLRSPFNPSLLETLLAFV